MPAGSVIFVIVVAIWAVYLLQHWSHRRENAAAARSVDGFTEAMRVLEKRAVPARTDVAEPRPHSYSVTPARIVRSTVEVKRAVPAGVARQPSPFVARRQCDTTPDIKPDIRPDTWPGTDPAEVETMSPAAASPQPRRRVSRARRRVRALLLLAALLWVPVSVTLAILGTILWISVPFSVLTVVAVLVWLRTEAQADRAKGAGGRRDRRRRPAAQPVLSSDDTQVIRQPHRYAAESSANPVTAPEHAATPAAGHASAPEAATAPDPATARASERVEVSSAASDTVFDVAATEPAPAAEATPVEAAPGTWSPVPVPTPTYAMKAKAEPRYTADGIPADVFDTPEFADEVDELDDRALFARRAASQ